LDAGASSGFHEFDSNFYNISHRLSALNHMEESEFPLGGLNGGDLAGLGHENMALLVEQLANGVANTHLDSGSANGFLPSPFFTHSSASSLLKFNGSIPHNQQNGGGGIGAGSLNQVDDSSSSHFRFLNDRIPSEFGAPANGEFSASSRQNNNNSGFNGQHNVGSGNFGYSGNQQSGTFGQSRPQNGAFGTSQQQNGGSSHLIGSFGQTAGGYNQQQSNGGGGYGQSPQGSASGTFGQNGSAFSQMNNGGTYGAQDGPSGFGSSGLFGQSNNSYNGQQNGLGGNMGSFPGHGSPVPNGNGMNGGYGYGGGTYSRRSLSPSDNFSSGRPPMREKKVNTTETVRVPSSEHVAEIVGRQGEGFCFYCVCMCAFSLIN
jgi:hypothetical protein